VAPRKSFLLRINADLWEEVNRWAADEFRSVNGQIEYILRRAVDERTHRRGATGGGSRVADDPDDPVQEQR
jgi:hypothetical protein